MNVLIFPGNSKRKVFIPAGILDTVAIYGNIRAELTDEECMKRILSVTALFIPVIYLIQGCATAPLKPGKDIKTEQQAPDYSSKLLREQSELLQSGEIDTADEIRSFSMLFRDNSRGRIDRDELYEFKYQAEQWRHAFLHDSIIRIKESEDPEEIWKELGLLEALPLRIFSEDLTAIGDHIESLDANRAPLYDAFRSLILKQGDFELTRELYDRYQTLKPFYAADSIIDGPDKTLKILPLINSKWSWKRWSAYSEFINYQRINDNVVYRGIEFKSGDVIISSLNSYSDSAFVVYSEKEDLATHMAVYIDIITQEGNFPAVFEMKSNGFRLVPLNVYLRPEFIAYAEIFRFRDLPPGFGEKLSETVLRILPEDHGFNLFADEEHSNNDQYVTCITACLYLFRQAGFSAVLPPETPIKKHFMEMNAHMGFTTEKMLIPSDLLGWEALRLTAVIDNGGFTDNIIRQLIIDKFDEYLMTWPISEKNGEYKFYRDSSGTTLKNTFLIAPVLRGLFGFNKDNFPMGTEQMLAFMELMPKDLKDAVHCLTPAISEIMKDYRLWDTFSYRSFYSNPEIQDLVEKSLKKAERWFEMKEE